MDADSWFNAKLLKFLRKELNWTQKELAQRTQLAVSVISKAEAGLAIPQEAVEKVVQALVAAGKNVTCDELACNPLALARKFLQNYAEYGADGIERSREFLAPDIDIHMDGDPITNPLAGNYRGIEQLDAIFRKFFAIFIRDGGTLGDPSQMKLVDQEVFAWGHEYVRVAQAPPQLPGFVMLKMKFAGGLMVRFEDYYEASGMMARIEDWAKLYPNAEWIKHFDLEMLSKGEHWLPHAGHEKKYRPGSANIFNKLVE
jgi:transcriptional regulator with XRE-family HTH domain